MAGCELLEDRLKRVLSNYGLTFERALDIGGDCIIDFRNKDYAESLKGDLGG
jgi:hypothetical protein